VCLEFFCNDCLVYIYCLLAVFFTLTHSSLLEYSPQSYNALLDYSKARRFAFDTDLIAEIGSIFLQHKVNDTFGLCLLHNHFFVQADEVMVEIVFNETSRTDPRNVDFLKSDQARPSMMSLTPAGDLVPLEFLDAGFSSFGPFQSTIVTVLQRFKDNLATFSDFFKAIAAKLVSVDRLSVFGVCIRHRDSITSVDPTHSSLETNHPMERWLKLDPMIYHSSKKEIIEAKWRRGEASATYWSFPQECLASCREDAGMCAECGCSGGMCAECGCMA